MVSACAKGLEGAGRRGGLTKVIDAPAGDGIIAGDGAGVIASKTDCLVGAGRRLRLHILVVSPTVDHSIAGNGARILGPHHDGCVRSFRWRRLAFGVKDGEKMYRVGGPIADSGG